MHNDLININLEKEKDNSNINNDNSFTLVENELYYSSPRRGIKSESNKSYLENKNYKITPFTATTESRGTYFTFNIFREAATDIGSKEENINSQKSSNITGEFSISNFKNSKLDNTNTNNSKILVTDKDEKEKEKIIDISTNIKEENEKEEYEENSDEKKFDSVKKENNDKLVRKYLSSDFDISTIPRSQRNTLNNLQDIKTKAKKNKKKSFKYTSLDYNEDNNKKSNEICTIDKVRRYSSVNYAFDSKRKKKKTLISNYYEDNADLESKILKDIKDRLRNHKERLSKKKKIMINW